MASLKFWPPYLSYLEYLATSCGSIAPCFLKVSLTPMRRLENKVCRNELAVNTCKSVLTLVKNHFCPNNLSPRALSTNGLCQNAFNREKLCSKSALVDV